MRPSFGKSENTTLYLHNSAKWRNWCSLTPWATLDEVDWATGTADTVWLFTTGGIRCAGGGKTTGCGGGMDVWIDGWIDGKACYSRIYRRSVSHSPKHVFSCIFLRSFLVWTYSSCNFVIYCTLHHELLLTSNRAFGYHPIYLFTFLVVFINSWIGS